MMRQAFFVSAAAIAVMLGGMSAPLVAAPAAAVPGAGVKEGAAVQDLLAYARGQKTTGFLIMRDGKTLVDENWPKPDDRLFSIFVYGKTDDGQLLEDVASQQKSFVAVLVGVAIDKGLIDVDRPVADYLGAGWSKASPDQEAKIRVIDVLTMSSGLDEKFGYVAPPGTKFFYNTPVYAMTKKILTAAVRKPLDRITRAWLTEPLGMRDTAWRQRPAKLADVGNATGLVTTPRDTAIFGQMVLAGGVAADGTRIISKASLSAMFKPSKANPAYGRLWWLNGSDFVVMPEDKHKTGQLIPSAPRDLVAALGFLDRRLYIVPSLKLIVVRTGAQAPDSAFDEHLWQRLMRVVE